jgi:cell division protein FtsA
VKNVLAIDIGSSKTVALIADITDEPNITGVGIKKSRGIKKGIIVNIEQAASSIKQAVNDARRMAGVEVNKALVSISTAYTQNTKSHGIVNIPTKEITISEINRAIQQALYNATIPNDYVIIQALPYNFKIDDMTSDIEDPEGMTGSRLEVAVHITIAQKSGVENTKKMLKAAGLKIENIVLNSFASAISSLNEDEKQQGAALVDIGATTSDLIIFKENSVRHIDFIGIGSYHITNDLAMALHTPVKEAELIKLNISKYSDEDIIEVPLIGDPTNTKSANISLIKEVMSARINETLIILNELIEKSGMKNKITSIVMTGGFSKLPNLREIAMPIFGNLSVRIAKPRELSGLFDNLKSPEYSTAVGLILYTLGEHSSYEIDSNRKFRSKYSINKLSFPEEGNNLFENGEEIDDEPSKPTNEPTNVVLPPANVQPKVSLVEKISIWLKSIF